ncbi:MAG TPA: amidase family protein [Vicinamibacterales bacterium]|nr:amidase family protein [Vicinamibacterales bacterium]
MVRRGRVRNPFPRAAGFLIGLSLVALASGPSVVAFNYVTDANGTWWGIQDSASPNVDTGSIRATQTGPGDCLFNTCVTPPYSTTINGFAGIKVLVQRTPAPRLNGEIMRGYGLVFDGVNHFRSTHSIDLGGVVLSRSVFINSGANWGRWLDTFTNSTESPITIQTAFGGQSGYGDPQSDPNDPLHSSRFNASSIVSTSSGDAIVTPEDAWVETATPLNGTTPVGGPQVTVIGTPNSPAAPFAGAMTFAGNWLDDAFHTPLSYSDHLGNFQAYVNTIKLEPGQSRSLLHFVVLGRMVTDTTSATERTSVETVAAQLVHAPDIDDLTVAEICSIDNFSVAALTARGFDQAQCKRRGRDGNGQGDNDAQRGHAAGVAQPPVPEQPRPTTSVSYDVVGKTIQQLRADLESGVTTSAEITRAYLDRIKFYDKGQLGFHAFEIVAEDALDQARAADKARSQGATGPLLGIPIAVKNLYDTSDLPTTNGSFTFGGFRPAHDAFQVARLRAAGVVIIGKTALEEYATYGSYSNDAYGQVWNVFNPSKSTIASSGGSGSALAANLAAGAMGSQTGDSLYGPSSAASLVTLRGTDGLESGTGVMPLVYLTDFGGAMARSVPDLADILNVVVATDPADPETSAPGRHVPADWRSVLDPNALKGKRIGFIPSRWVDPFATTNTVQIEQQRAMQYLTAAGATIVQMGGAFGPDTPPAPTSPTTNIRAEGWRRYIENHPELATQGFQIFSDVDVQCSQRKVEYVRATLSACSATPAPALTDADVQVWRDYRRGRQKTAAQWMDTATADGKPVDAVVYPGLLSDISLNDGGGSQSSFGRRDTPSASNGIPTVVFPVGYDDQGQPINVQLMGRAWDDDKLVGMAFAFEEVADAAGHGHVEATTAPPLEHHARRD